MINLSEEEKRYRLLWELTLRGGKQADTAGEIEAAPNGEAMRWFGKSKDYLAETRNV